MTTTEEHLGRFYIELQAWIDGGCEEHPVFSPYNGLCRNLCNWAHWDSFSALISEMSSQFVEAGLDDGGPFDGGIEGYNRAAHENRFTNPARLAWIKEHAEAAKAAGLAVTA